MTFAISLPDWPAVECRDVTARLWTRQWSALQFIIMRDRGEEALATLRQAILRRHQRAKFLKGVDKLGISRDLPPAVIAGRYHYLSNMIGGLRMQYAEENSKKVWVRYLPPSWSFPGPSICAIPSSAQRRMFAGWHPQNGKSLGCPRLGFVVTKVFQDGEPYDEGYFQEYDHDLAGDELIQYRPSLTSPDFDPNAAPRLDDAVWTTERLALAKRNFARGYLEDCIDTALEMFGVQTASHYLAQSSRLCAIQFCHDMRQTFDIKGKGAADLAAMFAAIDHIAEGKFAADITQGNTYTLSRNLAFAPERTWPEIRAALFEFPLMCAKIFGARVKLTRASLATGAEWDEIWTIEDVADRLF